MTRGTPTRSASPLDNLRDNDLETAGWRILRFNTHHIQEEMAEYCLPTIVENINRLGGVDEGRLVPRRINLDGPGGWQQLILFEPGIQTDASGPAGWPGSGGDEGVSGEGETEWQ